MTEPAATRPARQLATWPKDALRITFSVVWLVDAVLKWLPGFRSSYMTGLMGEAQGQPGWLHPWFNFRINLQHSQVTFFAYLVAVIETLIALALIFGFARKITYILAIVFSVLIWSTAEGFGGPYTSGASDIGTALRRCVPRAARAQLLRGSGSIERRLLPRTPHLVVVAGGRGAPPCSVRAGPCGGDPTAGTVTIPVGVCTNSRRRI